MHFLNVDTLSTSPDIEYAPSGYAALVDAPHDSGDRLHYPAKLKKVLDQLAKFHKQHDTLHNRVDLLRRRSHDLETQY